MKMNSFGSGLNSSSTSDVPTLDALQNTMELYHALRPKKTHDVYVMTTETFFLIRDEFRKKESPSASLNPLTMFGVPIEHYATLHDVHSRCMELRLAGKRVAMVS